MDCIQMDCIQVDCIHMDCIQMDCIQVDCIQVDCIQMDCIQIVVRSNETHITTDKLVNTNMEPIDLLKITFRCLYLPICIIKRYG